MSDVNIFAVEYIVRRNEDASRDTHLSGVSSADAWHAPTMTARVLVGEAAAIIDGACAQLLWRGFRLPGMFGGKECVLLPTRARATGKGLTQPCEKDVVLPQIASRTVEFAGSSGGVPA
jgi:hypothetical protein